MSIHALFRSAVSESVFSDFFNKSPSKRVDEAYDDNAVGWLTRNNILPQIFSGNRNGLRVKPALRQGVPLPKWDMDYLIYPFVGINGYSTSPAIVAKHGNYASYMRENLKTLNANANVRSVLEKQLNSNPHAIPGNGFLIYPKQPIETASSRDLVKSQSVFTPYNVKDVYSVSIYPYNVQQALSVDANGKLYVDESKSGGVVLRPIANSSQRGSQVSTSALMRAVKLTDEDLKRIAHLENRSILAKWVTGQNEMLDSYNSGARNFDRIPGGNPDYKNFEKFAESNGFLTDDGKIDVDGVRNWILTQPDEIILNGLIKPYLLMTPFDMTYCWHPLTIRDRIALKGDIAVYNALCSEGGDSVESGLEKADGSGLPQSGNETENEYFDVTFDEEDSGVGESEESEYEIEPKYFVNEATGETIEVGVELGAFELMDICRKYTKHAQPTFMMVPKERASAQLRDDGRIRTKSEGVKRTFVRILTENTPFNEIDAKFCPKNFAGMIPSHGGVLDYSKMFAEYPEMVDMNAPKAFKYTRIVGYMVSFQYDPELEREYSSKYHGKIRFNGMLDYYISSPNGVMFREPTIFDLLYVHGDSSAGYGDFIFSGYATNGHGGKFGGEPKPSVVDDIESKELFAADSGLHSVAAHGLGFQKIPYSYNKSVF